MFFLTSSVTSSSSGLVTRFSQRKGTPSSTQRTSLIELVRQNNLILYMQISTTKTHFGDNVIATGDDSDAFADDEAPSSDGMEERDDISLVSTVSSVGEDDNYLSEPTYNNLDPLWARRHGFGPGLMI